MKKLFYKIAFWKSWDEEKRANCSRFLGVVFAVFFLFSLIALVSYLFTWKPDKSVLGDPMMTDADVHVSNGGGKLGLKWADFLISDCFGLGSFALLVVLFAFSARLINSWWRTSLLRTVLGCMLGAFNLSMLLAFVGKLCNVPAAFGSGLGGRMGAFGFAFLQNHLGLPVAVVIVVLLCIASLMLVSRGFTNWLNGLFKKKEKPVIEEDFEEEEAKIEEKMSEIEEDEEIVEEETTAGANKVEEATETKDADVPEFEVEMGEDLDTEVKKDLPRIDPRVDDALGLPKYQFPPLDLLEDYASAQRQVSPEELNRNNNQIRMTLENYGIHVDDVKAIVGPTVTLYKVYPSAGVRISSIKSRQEDIAVSLAAKGVRIVILADSVGIEVANDKQATVPLKGLLNDDAFRNSKAELPIAIGCTIYNKVKVFDLADSPHLLVAGATKQGKSVGLNILISSLLYSKHPAELKMVFIDPKMVEFSAYGKLLKHYLAVLPDAVDADDERESAIIKNPKDAERVLRSLCVEMDERYFLLSKSFVNNIKLYNDKYRDRKLNPKEGHRFLPYLVVIIDEYADLIMTGGSSPEARAAAKSIMASIVRLAQKGRAAGIHVVIATQRPSVDVITGLIKANFPARIAFRVTTRIDSATILDQPGAEKLIGKGDMLYYAGVDTERVQCGFISNDETNKMMEFIYSQQGYHKSYSTPYYLPDPDPQAGTEGGVMIDMKDIDERFEEAAKQVVYSQKGSTSDLQRKLGMGYAKAGRVMDQLEAAGIVGPQIAPGKPREVLVADLNELEPILDAFLGR